MPNIDLSNAADFARATMSDAAGILSSISGAPAESWDIQEGSYNGILFHVFKSKKDAAGNSIDYNAAVDQIQDTTGRRKVKYTLPYVDGQTTDDLGRTPFTFDVDILIHGTRYMGAFQRLSAEFNKPSPGELVHPVRGPITCGVEDMTVMHMSSQRKAVLLKVKFIEHNFTIGSFQDLGNKTVKSAISNALAAFPMIANVLSSLDSYNRINTTLRASISFLVNKYNNDFSKNLTDVNSAFNGGSSADIPNLIPVNQGGLVASDGSLTSGQFPVVDQTNPLTSVPQSAVSPTTSLALQTIELQKQITALNSSAAEIITQLKAAGDGNGALFFYSNIMDIRRTVILMQNAFDQGVASSKAKIINYTLPRDMSIREVAFANGLALDEVNDLDILNPGLESVNFIAKGTVMKVSMS